MEFKLNIKPDYVPTLYDVNKSFNVIRNSVFSGITGEEYARMVLFTLFVLGKTNVILTGPRSSGKTNLIMVATSFCPRLKELSLSSDKVYLRTSKEFNDSSHLLLPEINKANPNLLEILKDLGEGKRALYEALDGFGKNKISFVIEPKPFITSIADENEAKVGEELMSRMTVITTDSSISQNDKVIKSKFEKAKNPYKKKVVSEAELNRIKDYIASLPSIEEYTFIHPMPSLANSIPNLFTDARRDTDKFLRNTYAITLFNKYDRIELKKGGKLNLFVTPTDCWYNHIIFSDILFQSSLKIDRTERMIIKIMKEFATQAKSRGSSARLKIKEIREELVRNQFTPSINMVRKHCDKLVANGHLVMTDNEFEIGSEMIFNYSVDWPTVVEEAKANIREDFPEIADEYIQKYCTGPLLITHPFTGEEFDILTHKEVVKVEAEHNTGNTLTAFSHFEQPKEAVIVEEMIGDEMVETVAKIDTRTGSPTEIIIDWVGKLDVGEGADVGEVETKANGSLRNVNFDKTIDKMKREGVLYEPKPGRIKILR